jgi:hypothetical protein
MLCKNNCRMFITQYSKSTSTILAIGQMSGSAEQAVSEKSMANTGNEVRCQVKFWS